MASKLLVFGLVVMLVGSAMAMYDFNDVGMEVDDGYGMGLFDDELHPIMEIKRDANRQKANKKYKACNPVPGSSQECWCFRKTGQIFYCFGASSGK